MFVSLGVWFTSFQPLWPQATRSKGLSLQSAEHPELVPKLASPPGMLPSQTQEREPDRLMEFSPGIQATPKGFSKRGAEMDRMLTAVLAGGVMKKLGGVEDNKACFPGKKKTITLN